MTGESDQRQLSFAGMPTRLYVASPSKLLTWEDCPRRYRMTYLDRPRPAPRPQRAHTSVGVVTHSVLRDFFAADPAERTPALVAQLVEAVWIPTGFRDDDQARKWRTKVVHQVTAYLKGIDRHQTPIGTERTVALRTDTLALTGRIDRVDDRDGELVIVDYKTGRSVPTEDDVRFSLPMALYAAAAQRIWRRERVRVELHHIPTGVIVGHDHGPDSVPRRVGEAESIAQDLRRADAEYAERGIEGTLERFAPRPSPLCRWCDLRAHCPTGQLVGPEKSSWAGLAGEDEEDRPGTGAIPVESALASD